MSPVRSSRPWTIAAGRSRSARNWSKRTPGRSVTGTGWPGAATCSASCWPSRANGARPSASSPGAIELRGALVRERPEDAEARSLLGVSWLNLGRLLADAGRLEESAHAFREAIGHERAALDDDPADRSQRALLSEAHSGLIAALLKLGRPAEAARLARDRRAIWPEDPDEQYDSACELALCVPGLGTGDRAACAADAMAALREAIRLGFDDLPLLKTDSDLAALRERDDPRALVRELEARPREAGR